MAQLARHHLQKNSERSPCSCVVSSRYSMRISPSSRGSPPPLPRVEQVLRIDKHLRIAPRFAAVFRTHPSHSRVTFVVIGAVRIEGQDLPVLILDECVPEMSASSRPGVIDEENPIVRRVLRDDIVSTPHAFLRTIRKRARLPALKFHDLRKTFGSLVAQAGFSTSTVQTLLEHSTPKLTHDIYTDINPVLRQAVESVPLDEITEL